MKRAISLLLVLLFLLLSVAFPAEAYDKNIHYEHLELVLFGVPWFSESRPLINKTVQRLKEASYLAIDQFNDAGQTELDNLNNDHIPGIPSSIEEIKFKANYTHRKYTHKGWNVTYVDEAHWTIRKDILLNTIKAKFPSINERQAEAFSVLIYYVHVLGDHIEATKYTSLANLAPLSNSHDRDNPGIIPDLIKYFAILFRDQQKEAQYKLLIQNLETLADKCDGLYHSVGGIQEKQFTEYHEYAECLLTILKDNVPILLKNEDFFHDVMY